MAFEQSQETSVGGDSNSIGALWSVLNSLWYKLTPQRKKKFRLLLLLMVVASFAEVVSIGAALPFLAVITDPETVFKHHLAHDLVIPLGLTESSQLLLPLTLFFCVAVVFSGVVRLVLVVASTRLSYSTGGEFSITMYRRTLYQPYSVHMERNSSEVLAGVLGKANGLVAYAIQPALIIISSLITLTVIFVSLVVIDPLVTLSIFGGFSLIYVGIARLFRQRLLISSHRIARETGRVIKALQEGLGGIRDVLIDNTQETYCRVFQDANIPLRKAQGDNQIISQAPRFLIEMIGMLLIAFVAYHITGRPDGLAVSIPILGTFAFAAQRTLPVIQQVYANFSVMRGGYASIKDALDLLSQPIQTNPVTTRKHIEFKQSIDLKCVTFRYPKSSEPAISNLTVKIPKGARLGIIGASGSGKSTLLDIIMGLIPPTEGVLVVDGRLVSGRAMASGKFSENAGGHDQDSGIKAWQSHIAHVPQTLFLADSTIEENIAFGIPYEKIDSRRVRYAAARARISEVIERLPDQYQTVVGERGVRLSGGQRQRIGIARALYKHADVIIFDEATSALDSETEEAVIEAIEGLSRDLTIIIVAHRLSTLRNCTEIIELVGGKVSRYTSYQQLVAST